VADGNLPGARKRRRFHCRDHRALERASTDRYRCVTLGPLRGKIVRARVKNGAARGRTFSPKYFALERGRKKDGKVHRRIRAPRMRKRSRRLQLDTTISINALGGGGGGAADEGKPGAKKLQTLARAENGRQSRRWIGVSNSNTNKCPAR